jgi:hypothetical protein
MTQLTKEDENEVKVELTIRMSNWLDKDVLLKRIQAELEWPLATGGCSITKAEIHELEP